MDFIALNVLGIRRFFVPDEEKCEAFLRAQKNVAELNPTKGVPARKRTPDWGFVEPKLPEQGNLRIPFVEAVEFIEKHNMTFNIN